jgi:hypothetical protein
MRLYPVVSSGTIRITHKPMQLGPYSLPAGQPVLIPFFSIHRSPRLWEDPDAFKPERWLVGDAAAVAAEAGAAGSREARADGQAAAVSAGVVPEAEDEDYVDVAADISAMKDQTPQQQQQQQQGVKDSKQQLGSSTGDAQHQRRPAAAAAAAAAAKAGGSGLEIKVRGCGNTRLWLMLHRTASLQKLLRCCWWARP